MRILSEAEDTKCKSSVSLLYLIHDPTSLNKPS